MLHKQGRELSLTLSENIGHDVMRYKRPSCRTTTTPAITTTATGTTATATATSPSIRAIARSLRAHKLDFEIFELCLERFELFCFLLIDCLIQSSQRLRIDGACVGESRDNLLQCCQVRRNMPRICWILMYNTLLLTYVLDVGLNLHAEPLHAFRHLCILIRHRRINPTLLA